MKNRQLITLSSVALAGIVFSASYAQALTFSYNAGNSGVGTFSYDVTLDAGENFDLGDPLVLTGLGGITAVDSDDNLDLQFLVNGFDSISANFTVSDDASGAQTFTNAIILSSSNSLGTINYEASTSAGAFNGTTQGPVPVPFEPSANLGIFIIMFLMGLNYYRKNFKAQ